MMQLYGLKTCDSCRKALKELPDAVLVDVRADGVPTDTLVAALAQFGSKVINTRSTTWRELSEAARAAAPIALLQAHPTVMKRPLIVDGDAIYLGWDSQTRAELLS